MQIPEIQPKKDTVVAHTNNASNWKANVSTRSVSLGYMMSIRQLVIQRETMSQKPKAKST